MHTKKTYKKHTTQVPVHSPAGTCRQPRYPCSTPRVQFAPCPLPPPCLYTSKFYRAFFPFNLPPSKRERDVQQVQVKGGGGGVLGLIPVCFRWAQTIWEAVIYVKMSSVKAHGHTGSPPHLGHSWQKQHMGVHIAISRHVGTPPPRRGTDGKLVGRHIDGLRKHICS
jgi:hypothetical protein